MADLKDEEDLAELYHQTGNVRDDEGGGQEDAAPHVDMAEILKDLENISFEDLGKMAKRQVLLNLLAAVKGGWASHQDYSNLIRFLKDNGMTMGDPLDEPKDTTVPVKKADLPEFGRPEYAN